MSPNAVDFSCFLTTNSMYIFTMASNKGPITDDSGNYLNSLTLYLFQQHKDDSSSMSAYYRTCEHPSQKPHAAPGQAFPSLLAE